MMRKKFGGYTINIIKKTKEVHEDGLIVLTATISGNIEIGLDIDRYTWREDWFLQLFFKGEYSKYRAITLENHTKYENYNEVNYITATVRRR